MADYKLSPAFYIKNLNPGEHLIVTNDDECFVFDSYKQNMDFPWLINLYGVKHPEECALVDKKISINKAHVKYLFL